MLPEYFAIITIVLSFVGGLDYIVSTLKGETKPNRVTWVLLTLFTGIVFLAGLDAGAGWALAGTGVALFNVATIVLASFINKKSYWKSQRQDYVFAVIALLGLALWQITDNANLAVAFSIVADFSAALPTFIKAYKHPETENGTAFLLWTVAQAIILLIIDDWSFVVYAFPIYLVLFNGTLGYLITIRPRLLQR